MKTLVFVLAAACALVLASGAFATPVTQSPELTGGSWGIGWHDPETQPYNVVQIETSGVTGRFFEIPDIRGQAAGWTITIDTTTAAQMKGPVAGATDVNFQIWWNLPPVDQTSFQWQVFQAPAQGAATLVGSYEVVYYNGTPAPSVDNIHVFNANNGWYAFEGTLLDAPLSTVPEPISMIFFGTGLVAVGGFVARRRMQRA